MSNNIRPCKFCDPPQDIHPNADVYGKWHPTNLDGSKHKHVKAGYPPQATQGQAMRKSYPDTAPPHTDENDDEGYEDKMQDPVESTTTTKQQFFNQRDADIKKAHDENIKAKTALTNAIHVLAAAISKLADKQRDESAGFERMNFGEAGGGDNLDNER